MLLPDWRYEQIKDGVADAFEACGVDSIPVDAFAVARGLGIDVLAYSELGEEVRAAALKLSPNGFKFVLQSGAAKNARIYCNDAQPSGRVRFTLLHEIGHIALGHLEDSDVAEAEANFFAKFAIAPPSLVHVIRPNDYLDIAAAFGVSRKCALYSWNYYQKWLRAESEGDYEQRLSRLFVISNAKGGAGVLRTRRGA